VTDISRYRTTPATAGAVETHLLICDRCHNADEIVVAIMQIEQLGESLALCGPCARELPNGFHIA
jgi:hypothetical protein